MSAPYHHNRLFSHRRHLISLLSTFYFLTSAGDDDFGDDVNTALPPKNHRYAHSVTKAYITSSPSSCSATAVVAIVALTSCEPSIYVNVVTAGGRRRGFDSVDVSSSAASSVAVFTVMWGHVHD